MTAWLCVIYMHMLNWVYHHKKSRWQLWLLASLELFIVTGKHFYFTVAILACICFSIRSFRSGMRHLESCSRRFRPLILSLTSALLLLTTRPSSLRWLTNKSASTNISHLLFDWDIVRLKLLKFSRLQESRNYLRATITEVKNWISLVQLQS